MSKVKEMVKAMITEEQLKTVQEQQAKLTEGLRTLGVLDVQKQNVHGQINIDLTDGSYTDIEKEDAE